MEANMEVRIACPICGQAQVDPLQEHLKTHSKQSLIDILLMQHQQIRRQISPSNTVQVVSRGELIADGMLECSIDSGRDSTQFISEIIPGYSAPTVNIKSDLVSARLTHNQKSSLGSVLHIQVDGSTSGQNQNLKSKVGHGHIKVEKGVSSHVTKETKASKALSGQPTFVLVDHGSSKPGPSRRRVSDERQQIENMKSSVTESEGQTATSIIQYIIDESGQITDSPQEEPDSWILADGRTIPVYSSLTQVPAVTETASCTINVDIPVKVQESETIPITVERNPSHSQMHLDLMTDEEIPPRGEISEYEESNASSILSEDSVSFQTIKT